MSIAGLRLGAREAEARLPSLLGGRVQPLLVSQLAWCPSPTVWVALVISTFLCRRGGGIDDLNVDNVDQPPRLPGADAPILFVSFFDLVPPGGAKRSPSSVHRASSSDEGASKDTDVASGKAIVLVAPVKGAVEVIVPNNDERSGDNSLLGQHIPNGDDHHVAPRREGSGGSSSVPAPPLDINVEFVEPFRQLVSSYSVQLQRPLRSLVQKCLTCTLTSFRDGFIEGMDALSDPDDFDHLLGLCDSLEHSLKNLDASSMGLQALVRLLTRFHDYWPLSSRQITLPFAPEYVHAGNVRFLNAEQEVKQLNASIEENERRYRLALEARNQQIKDHKAKAALIDALRDDLKAVEERGVSLLMDSGRLKKVEHDLLSTLSEVRRIKEVELNL
ncbi:hypothetical protein ACLOJK_035036 [Asimina triloba]